MQLFNKIFIVFFSLLRGLKNKIIKTHVSNNEKRVLILLSGIIGDAVCFLDSLDAYTSIFPKNEGYKITYAVKPVVHEFYNACSISSKYDFFELDFNKYCKCFNYYNDINKKIASIKFAKVIVPQKSISAAIVSLNLHAKEKSCLCYPIKVKNKLRALIYNIAFTSKINVAADCTVVKSMNLVVNYYSKTYIPARMPQIPLISTDKGLIIKKGKYCIIAPGSSRYEKEWDLTNYIEISNKLVALGYNVYICGNKILKTKLNEFYEKIKDANSVVNLCEKTNFEQWIQLIRGAEIVVGCDSASIHIAAATNTPSVCILGGMDYQLIYPYQIDELYDNQHIPSCITCEHLNCFGCRRVGEEYGYKNKACQDLIKSGQPILCIQKITVYQVWSEIEKALKMKEAVI